MDRSVKSIREMLRENVARFLEHANGREVIITVTARLVKKQNKEQKKLEQDVKIEHRKRNHTKYVNNTASQTDKSTSVYSQNNNSATKWYDKRKNRYHYGKE
ncbi:unnamed protein product [Brugia pahangi]|uniref:Alba domain-containing protein n=1 Tax=Brugia pahangi TaxID=6280 RepID=A0A0N4TW88_BRUPA|nr:unnamed protein product [Brugia pahangi]